METTQEYCVLFWPNPGSNVLFWIPTLCDPASKELHILAP